MNTTATDERIIRVGRTTDLPPSYIPFRGTDEVAALKMLALIPGADAMYVYTSDSGKWKIIAFVNNAATQLAFAQEAAEKKVKNG